MLNEPSESFWQMSALVIAGRLASCQSCVEYYYFQSQQNAVAFLESCERGGLVERVSLLDLFGDIGPRQPPTAQQRWFDQPIYIPAPTFRNRYMDAARRRIQNTKRAVYDAFRLYYEELRADDTAISVAYLDAVKKGKLRNSKVAEKRQDVDMSPVAKLRLIQDGYRYSMKKVKPLIPREELEREAAKKCVTYILSFTGHKLEPASISDHAEELQDFIAEFLLQERPLEKYWRPEFGEMPTDSRLQLMPVIRELVFYRYDALNNDSPNSAQTFLALIKDKIRQAQATKYSDAYSEALSELSDDLDYHVSKYGAPVAMVDSTEIGKGIHLI